MDRILKPIGDSLSSISESDIVQFGLRMIGVYLVILWLATAYWAFRDMQQRSDKCHPAVPRGCRDHPVHPGLLHLRVLDLQDRPSAREDRRSVGAQPRGGGPAR